MKKLLLAAVLLSLTSVSQAAPSHPYTSQAASTYTCYRYVDGRPSGGFVKISADSKSEAEAKALAWYQKEGMKVDYVVCE